MTQSERVGHSSHTCFRSARFPVWLSALGLGDLVSRASPPALCVCRLPLPPAPSFLEHLHKHQGSVLHPDYKTAFPSFEDALHRLLPYHVYQGALPSPNDYHKGEASRTLPRLVPGACAEVGGQGAEGGEEQVRARLSAVRARALRAHPSAAPPAVPLDLTSSPCSGRGV